MPRDSRGEWYPSPYVKESSGPFMMASTSMTFPTSIRFKIGDDTLFDPRVLPLTGRELSLVEPMPVDWGGTFGATFMDGPIIPYHSEGPWMR